MIATAGLCPTRRTTPAETTTKKKRTVTVHRTVCFLCAARYGGLVSPTCPVCGGYGTLILGSDALSKEDPHIVARAAQKVLAPFGWRLPESDSDVAVSDMMLRVIDGGLVEPVPVVGAQPNRAPDADVRRRDDRRAGQIAKRFDGEPAPTPTRTPKRRWSKRVAATRAPNVIDMSTFAARRRND